MMTIRVDCAVTGKPFLVNIASILNVMKSANNHGACLIFHNMALHTQESVEKVRQLIQEAANTRYPDQASEPEFTSIERPETGFQLYSEEGLIETLTTGWPDQRILAAMELALREMNKAREKFPTWPTDPIHAVNILVEECGELAKEVNQSVYEPEKTSHEKVKKEAMQTAAMAIRFLANLLRYKPVKSEHTEG